MSSGKMENSKFDEMLSAMELAAAHHKILHTSKNFGRAAVEYRKLMMSIHRMAAHERKVAMAIANEKKKKKGAAKEPVETGEEDAGENVEENLAESGEESPEADDVIPDAPPKLVRLRGKAGPSKPSEKAVKVRRSHTKK